MQLSTDLFAIPVEIIKEFVNPFEEPVWNGEVLSDKMIEHSTPIAEYYLNLGDDNRKEWTIEQHAGRVKYLVENGWDNPIILDVGVPSLNYYNKMLLDGNHRFAASIFKKEKTIIAELNGEIEPYSKFKVNIDELCIFMAKPTD